MTFESFLAAHDAPARLPLSAAESVRRDDARDARASGLYPAESFGTFYAPYQGSGVPERAVATLTRPALYGDKAAFGPHVGGLFTLALTDGRVVAAFARVPTVARVRAALSAYVMAGDTVPEIAPAGGNAADLESMADLAAERARAEYATAADSRFDTFRASAFNRAVIAARVAALAADAAAAARDLAAAVTAGTNCPCGFILGPDGCHDCNADELADADERAAERRAELAAPTSAELAALAVRASTPALESVARVIVARIATGAATGRDYIRLRVVASALSTRQRMGAAPAPHNATRAFIASASARRAELDSAFALHVRPAQAPVFWGAF